MKVSEKTDLVVFLRHIYTKEIKWSKSNRGGIPHNLEASTPEFLQRLRQFVQDEADTQYRELTRQWPHSLGDRIAKGWAIEGLALSK